MLAAEPRYGMIELDVRRLLEEQRGEVGAGAHARRAVAELAGIGLRVRDEVRHGVERHLGADRHRERHEQHARDEREVARHLVRNGLLERRQHRDAVRVGHEERVAVGRRLRRELDAHGRRGPGLVLDHDRLAELGAQEIRHDAPRLVHAARGGVGHDQVDGSTGIRLAQRGLCERGRRERGNGNAGGNESHMSLLDVRIGAACPAACRTSKGLQR